MEFTTAAEVQGRKTWQAYAPGTNGQRRTMAILLDDWNQGKTPSDAYVSGTAGMMYCPQMGDEMHILISGSVAGSGTGTASLTVGTTLICQSGSGKFVPTTGSPQSEPFRLMEQVDYPFSTDEVDLLARAMYTGY